MVSGHLFHCRKNSWPPEEYVGRTALQLLDLDGGSPPEQAWRRRLNSHANILKEFSVTFMEAMKMMTLGVRLWSYVREEASHGRKAPIDPFTRERCKPSASQGVPLGGMGVVAFQEDSGESSRIGTSFLVCVRIRRSWRTSFLYLYHETVGIKNTHRYWLLDTMKA
ncbi:unnamed protein product [Triticum turgidum subsp. durum]|uniref:Uncharacterized protein n=1 Tax=Triticum turgidum subsp. durum TaxID=4567 RepID=A0A9R0QRD0_TRITD|nr:unnamed protein product [Triticum turgidum subsp. durum]